MKQRLAALSASEVRMAQMERQLKEKEEQVGIPPAPQSIIPDPG